MKKTNNIDPIIHEFLKQNAKKGGEAIKRQRGEDYFSTLAKKRWAVKKAKQ